MFSLVMHSNSKIIYSQIWDIFYAKGSFIIMLNNNLADLKRIDEFLKIEAGGWRERGLTEVKSGKARVLKIYKI